MHNVTYSQIQEILNTEDFSKFPPLNIVVLRNVMIDSIVPYLKYLAYQMGFEAKVALGEYDNIVQEALGRQNGLIREDTDCVMVFMRMETLSWNLSRNFVALSADEISRETANIKEHITNVLTGIRKQTNGMILWQNFELPLYPTLGIWDSQLSRGEWNTIRELNEFLRGALKNIPNAYCVDLNLCLGRLGIKNFYDQRYWHIGKAPYSREALQEISGENFKFIRSLKGKSKKCLVLDCDNVLWGGIVGEDGLPGIKLGKTYPGSAYYEFQQEILNLFNRGVLIALCSKNNPDDVWEVFRNHPDMVLKEKHITVAEINWDDKATNLKKIAANLNIGLDSLVFVDDSDFEINLVKQALPEVTVIHLPHTQAVEYRNVLVQCGLFDTLTVSAEDRERGAMYKAETERKKLQGQVTDLKEYLKSLEMSVELKFADNFTMPRIAQLTQKTNQFNLTTRRYSEADIKKYSEAKDADVFSLSITDKFGNSGLVGVCILKYQDRKAVFDTFLLSCRVLGRGVEEVFLSQALKLAQHRGCEIAIGEYIPTSKNSQIRDFLPKQGFAPLPEAEHSFGFRLSGPIKEEPAYFKSIRSAINS